MGEEPEPVRVTATCRTDGCPAEGQGIVTDMYPIGDPPEFRAQCVPCGQPVTDIVPVG